MRLGLFVVVMLDGGATQNIGGSFVRETKVVFNRSALLNFEEDNGRGAEHASDKETPTRGELCHVRGLDGIEAEPVVSR